MDSEDKIWVAGHKGLVGSALIRQLEKQGYHNILTSDVNLTVQTDVYDWVIDNQPKYVFLAAAKVGGIKSNSMNPATFMYDNLMIQTNVIDAVASFGGAKKLCFLGTACIYPKLAHVPIKEEALMTGPLEETNSGYAVAKIAGLTMCQKYTEQYGFNTISVMPNNLYGINDNFILDECHVIPAMIRKFIEAKERGETTVTLFGTGMVSREFMFADDLADALIFLINNHDDPKPINVGPNREVSILGLAHLIADLVGYVGKINWDKTKPDGTPRRVLDTSKMDALGWKAKTPLEQGLKETIVWYRNNRGTGKVRE